VNIPEVDEDNNIMADDDPCCTICGTHFTTEKSLAMHMAAIHKSTPANGESSGTGAEAVKHKRPREEPATEAPDEPDVPSENVELEPLLGVLSEAQKDALLLRAVQHDPSFYERILEQASTPLTAEAADARLGALEPNGILTAVRWFVTIGAPANALALLLATSERCLAALDNLGDPAIAAEPGKAAGQAAGSDDDEEDGGCESSRDAMIRAVEALPAVGAVGALWAELLKGKKTVRRLVCGMGSESVNEGGRLRLLLEGLEAASATVRPIAPALLVGTEGEKAETITQALAALDAAEVEVERLAIAGAAGKKKKQT
jgi:hypothetical protein